MDSVLVLTGEAYYVTDYDETSDRLLSVQRVPLKDVTSIELGTLDSSATVIKNIHTHTNRHIYYMLYIMYFFILFHGVSRILYI